MVAGCSNGGGSQSPQGDSSPLPEYHGSDLPASTPPTALRWDEADQRAAQDLALKVMRLFARPDVSASTWYSDLEPYLSPAAQEAYYATDPANVPVTTVTGAVQLVDASNELVAIAHLPTDNGLYAITMSRSPEQPTWAVERITPPEDVGD